MRKINKKDFANDINKLAKEKGIDNHLIDKRKVGRLSNELLSNMLVELHLAPSQK